MPMLTSFNAGEFSDLMDASVDLDKHSWSVKTLKNMICLKQGPAIRRGPSVFVKEVKTSANRTHLLSFQFSNEDAYILEMGNLYMRVFKNYANVVSGMSPYELVTPYAQADLFDSNGIFQIHSTQSGDVMYLVHGSYSPRVLTRTSDTAWSINEIVMEDGPYLDENVTTTTLSFSGTTGSVTVTASAALFASGDVGRLIRVKHTNWSWLKITAYTDSTHVTATVMGAAISTGAVTTWRLGVFSPRTGWPKTVAFFQDRVFMGGCSSYPDFWALSKTGGYSSTTITFQPSDATGTVADDNSVVGFLPSREVNSIRWATSDSRGLVVGTSRDEFVIRASSLGESITPSNATSTLFSSTGSAYIQPVRTLSGSTFVQYARRKVFDIIYSFEEDTLKPLDTTLAADHITEGQVLGMCYQQEPANIIWAWKGDGVLIGLTHYPEQKVWGWHRHHIGGVSDVGGSNAYIECAATVRSSDGKRDDLWIIVRRYINGNTVRYVEYFKPFYDSEQVLEDSACCDSRFTYDGVATDTVTGLTHLEGETVKVMVDGRAHPDLVVTSGEIVLENSRTGSVIQVGLPYEWQLVTNKYEVKLQNGDTAQGKKKRFMSFVMRLLNTLGLKYGVPNEELIEHDFEQGQNYDTTQTLFSGDTDDIVWPGGTDSDGQMEFSSDSVFPVCILGIIPKVKVQQAGRQVKVQL